MNGTARLTLVPSAEVASIGVRPASRPDPALRLTRRGRLAVLIVFLVAALGTGVLVGSGPSRASGETGPPREHQYVVVQPGQTLWGIAREAAPGADPRATIEQIRRLNALSSTGVQAGQRIALP